MPHNFAGTDGDVVEKDLPGVVVVEFHYRAIDAAVAFIFAVDGGAVFADTQKGLIVADTEGFAGRKKPKRFNDVGLPLSIVPQKDIDSGNKFKFLEFKISEILNL